MAPLIGTVSSRGSVTAMSNAQAHAKTSTSSTAKPKKNFIQQNMKKISAQSEELRKQKNSAPAKKGLVRQQAKVAVATKAHKPAEEIIKQQEPEQLKEEVSKKPKKNVTFGEEVEIKLLDGKGRSQTGSVPLPKGDAKLLKESDSSSSDDSDSDCDIKPTGPKSFRLSRTDRNYRAFMDGCARGYGLEFAYDHDFYGKDPEEFNLERALKAVE